MIKNKIGILVGMVILAAAILLPLSVNATPNTCKIKLRVEGVSGNIFYGEVEVINDGSLTVSEALAYIDAHNEQLSIIGVENSYITEINGEIAADFTAAGAIYDGWLYKVNGTEPYNSIADCLINDGDEILLYYGDPYGVGMQYPKVDKTQIGMGILNFTSDDTTYNENWEPVVTQNPVSGATVTWYYGSQGQSVSYTTDENGYITIDEQYLDAGEHAIQIEKTGAIEAGNKKLPLILRFSPDYKIDVPVPTGESMNLAFWAIPVMVSGLAIVFIINFRRKVAG